MSAVFERVAVVRRSARVERLRAVAPRYLLLAALALTSLVGARELVAPRESAPAAAPRLTPDYALEEFAQGFARAYLSWDADRSELRDRALAHFAPEGMDAGAGLAPPPQGSQLVTWTRVAQNQEALAGGRIVVVAAGIGGARQPIYLAVPVTRLEDGAIALTGYPSLVGPPARARVDFAAREEVEDKEVMAVVERAVRNYLAGEREDLAADLAAGAPIAIPEQRLVVEVVDEVVWAAGPDSGAVLATVVARDELGARWTLTYELGVERVRGRVVVSFIETLANET